MADFGIALSCVRDIDPAARTVTGFAVVAQAIARRLITPRGRLIGYPNYGYDIRQWINADVSPRDIAEIQASIQAECVKDPRVASAIATVVFSDSVITITILVNAASGPFRLVLVVSDVTVDLLELS